MNFHPLNPKLKRAHEDQERGVQKKDSCEFTNYKKMFPMLTRRQIAYQLYTFFRNIGEQGRAIGMNDLLNELRNKNLKMFGPALQETLMTMENEMKRDCLGSLIHRHLEKSTLMKTVLALCYPDQIHREEPKSYTKLKASVTHSLEGQTKRSSLKEVVSRTKQSQSFA